MGNFSIQNQTASKKLFIVVENAFSIEDANRYLEEYNKVLKSIVPSQYDLFIDSSKQQVVSTEVISLLESALELYKKSGFKSTTVISNAIFKIQLKRIVKKIGFDNIQIN